jgi:hypothetical protein
MTYGLNARFRVSTNLGLVRLNAYPYYSIIFEVKFSNLLQSFADM